MSVKVPDPIADPKPYESDLQFRSDDERQDWLRVVAGAASQPNATTENVLWFADDAIKGARERSTMLDKRGEPVWWLWRLDEDDIAEGWCGPTNGTGETYLECTKRAENLSSNFRPNEIGRLQIRLYDANLPRCAAIDRPIWWLWIPEGRTVTTAGWLEVEGRDVAPPTTHAKLVELRTNAALAGARIFGNDRKWDPNLPTVVRIAPTTVG